MRNEARQITACLESIAALAYGPLEILVVDDGSEDGTPAVIGAWMKQRGDARFRLLSAPGEPPPGWVGKTFAVHYAVERSTGELILSTDADVRHSPGSLAESVRMLGEKAMLVRLPFVPFEHPGAAFADFLLTTILVATRVARAMGGLPLSFGAYVLMRRSFYDSCGGFERQRSFPESLPLARLAAAGGGYVLRRPSRAVSAALYETLPQALHGTLRNINFGLMSPLAALASFVFVGFPLLMLFALAPAPAAWAGFILWCLAVAVHEYSCGRGLTETLALAALAPLNALLLALISCAAVVRRALGIPVVWRGRRMRVQ